MEDKREQSRVYDIVCKRETIIKRPFRRRHNV
jgi:hypothetical protein